MKRMTGSWLAVGAVLMSAVGAPALAENPLGAYIGAGVGVSYVGNNNYCCGYPYGYYNGGYNNGGNVAWKALAGIRPIPVVGAELEYLDFGSSNGNNGYYSNYYNFGANSHPKATMLFAVGYLPIPVPFLDVYGKLGAAHLQTNISFNTCTDPSCNVVSTYSVDQSNTKFAYGAGVQWRWQAFGFRAEYEGVASEYGNPEALMFSATWTF